MAVNIFTIIAIDTAKTILSYGLGVAEAIGLDTTSWRTGDPTRSLYVFLANYLATKELATVEYIKGGILSLASGDWLKVHSKEVYGVEPVAADYATSTITLLNSGGGYYTIDPGDYTAKCTATGKTYHNTSGPITLTGVGSTGTLDVVADEPGSASSAGVNEIDASVTSLLGVSITASTAAVGLDDQDDSSIKVQCNATLGALSPDGPPDAYEYVCRNPDLTGTLEITRAASSEDSDNLAVSIWVAGASGAVTGGAVTLAQAAVMKWAKPLCVTPTVINASEVVQAVSATITGVDLPVALTADATGALGQLFATLRISTAEHPTLIARSAVIKVLQDAAVSGGGSDVSVSLTTPAADVTLTAGQVSKLGAVTIG